MRLHVYFFCFLTLCLATRSMAIEGAGPAAQKFELPAAPEGGAPSRFTAEQLAFVQTWVRQLVPDFPADLSATVADGFLEELAARQPQHFDRLLQRDFPQQRYASSLLRQAGQKLTVASQAPLREKIAAQRIGLLLADNQPGGDAPAGSTMMEKIREASPFQHRRVVEGRLDDDELRLQLKKIIQPASERVQPAPVAPKELTGPEIVSEFGRRNQNGNALQRLQAYTVEGRLTPPVGEPQHLLLFKMRPDAFRLVVRTGGTTRYVMAADGKRFWVQAEGKSPQAGTAENFGARRYLGEFFDPLFGEENYTFERKPDGEEAGKKFFRVEVRRTDGSKYVARIDPENFREIGRENSDKSVVAYSDFREIAGVILAFREQAVDANGQTSVLVIDRVTPNPGILRDLFRMPTAGSLDYFALQAAWQPPTAVSGGNRP